MENSTLFITGFCIFSVYIFFLLKMINKQHGIQKNALEKSDKSDKSKDNNVL
jgi:large-conductance mechanosensitive channel